MTSYKKNLEHLLDELRRIDLIVSLHCSRFKAEHGERADGFQGLFISDNEIKTILATHPYSTECYPGEELDKIDTMIEEIRRKKLKTLREGKSLCLHTLSELFHLTPFEIDALLTYLAPEFDLHYETFINMHVYVKFHSEYPQIQ